MAEVRSEDRGERLGREKHLTTPTQQQGVQHRSPGAGADAALELINETGPLSVTADPETRRKLVRKIDWHIMPLIW